MALSRQALSDYDSSLSKVEGAAADYVYKRLDAYLQRFPEASVADARDFAISVVNAAVDAYGDAASTLAADLYDTLADASPKTLPTATVDTSDVSGYVDRDVRYQAGKLVEGAPTEFARAVAMSVSDQVSRLANSTMMRNVGRDRVRYARVPLGVETCDFCAMLASRGFVYRTAASAGEMSHWHRNCRCKVIPGMEGDFTVEGYSGEQYEALARADAEIDSDPTLTPEQRDAARRALQEYDAAESYTAYRGSGIAGRVKSSGQRRRARRGDALFASAEGDPERLARYVAGARSDSDLMYRASRAVGDMAARRDWASVAALRDVAESTERGIAAGRTEGEAGGGTVAAGPTAPIPSGTRGPGALNVRAHARTGGFSRDELSARQRDYESVRGYKPVILARSEYARVVSELNTNMSAEDRKRGVLTKAIGNYRYTFINRGFDDYVFVRKEKLG